MRSNSFAKATTLTSRNDFSAEGETLPGELRDAENTLAQLASVFFTADSTRDNVSESKDDLPGVTEIYRILVEQIPAVVFIAFFDKSFAEAYVSPQIEAVLGYTQKEWLNDPVRLYNHIHPDDKDRWSSEVAQIVGSWYVGHIRRNSFARGSGISVVSLPDIKWYIKISTM